MSELTKRVLFAVPAALLLLGSMWIGGIYFELIIGIIAAFTLWEIHRLVVKSNAPDFYWVSWLIALSIWFSVRLPEMVVLGFGVILALPTIWTFFSKKNERSRRWLSTLFCGVYAPLGFLMLVRIRNLGVEIEGFWLAIAVLLMIWGNDVFAYFGGKRFGKTPLAPRVSPNKTWEGFFFGFLGAAVGLMIAFSFATPFPVALLIILPAVIIASIFGPIGDLLESRLKRIAGVKDSSNLLPGHGGFFDRFDALILSTPFFFFYFSLVL
ncbi:MAG: phosphatidate cytidylyltransferase [Balneolaceae bacterium]